MSLSQGVSDSLLCLRKGLKISRRYRQGNYDVVFTGLPAWTQSGRFKQQCGQLRLEAQNMRYGISSSAQPSMFLCFAERLRSFAREGRGLCELEIELGTAMGSASIFLASFLHCCLSSHRISS